jgi:hypothetical protein
MNLMIYLPLGMEEGPYQVTLSSGNGPALLQLAGEARLENGLAVLRVQADLSSLPAGTNRLRFRRQGESGTSSVSLIELCNAVIFVAKDGSGLKGVLISAKAARQRW